jgi:cell division protein FtsQ
MSRRSAKPGSNLRALVAGITAPADQRFRRPDSRPIRRRTSVLVSRFWKPAVAVVAVPAILAATAGVVLTAPGLAIDRIVVRGQMRMPASTVEGLLADLRGHNILRADLEAARARVLGTPWVEEASLWRVLPRTIEVRVIERTPIALARLGQRLHLMDASGVVMAEFGPAYQDLDLPIVDGLGRAPARGDARLDPARADLVRRFLEAVEARPSLKERVSQIDVSHPRDVVVLLDDDSASLHLGQEQFVERLESYLQMLPWLGDQFQDLESVDLRFDERLIVTPRGGSGSAVARAGWRK